MTQPRSFSHWFPQRFWQKRHAILSLLAFSPLLLSGCPVYGDRPQTSAVNCEQTGGAPSNSTSESDCKCTDLKVLEVGDPIPGMDPNAIPRRGGSIRIHLDANLPSLNRLTESDSWIQRIVHHDIYQSLIRQNPRTYTFQPELAEAWSHNELGTEWTFKLRQGVKWHDGQPFTSKDVLFTFQALLNPNNRTEMLRSDWQDTLAPVNPYEAPDAQTFIIRLKRPLANFQANVEDLPIVPAHLFSRGDFNNHPNSRKPIGTGPFRFVEWNEENIILERNPEYWGLPAYLDKIEYRVVTDRDTAFAMTQRGDMDFMERLMPEHRASRITPELLEKYTLIDYVPSQYSFFVYNTLRPQFADARTRKAMTMLIDRERLLCEIYQCQGIEALGPLQRSHAGFDRGVKPIPYDPTAAAALLEEAGWIDTDGDGIRDKEIDGQRVPFSITFLLTQSSRTLEQTITVVQNAAKGVGVDIQISKIDWSVFISRLRKHEFDFAGLIWILNHDPDLFGNFNSKGGQNYGSFKHPELERLTDEVRFILDDTTRNAVVRRIHQLVYQEQPYSFLLAQVRPGLIRKDIQGVYTSDFWYQEYDMWINDPKLPEVPVAERHPGHPGGPPLTQEVK